MGEFTPQILPNMCKWLGITLGHGPEDLPGAQGAVKRMAGVAPRIVVRALPRMASATGRVCTTSLLDPTTMPNPRSTTRATPFRLLFGQEARIQLDTLTPGIDGTDVFSRSP